MMAIYSYVCMQCSTSFEHSSSAKDWKEWRKCPQCGKRAHHSIALDHKNGNTYGFEYEFEGSTGTRMYGASYLNNQIDEARKKHPGTSFIWYNNCWLPRIKNLSHKRKYLCEYGNYVEYS